MTECFVPPEYPYERLRSVVKEAGKHPGGSVDMSVGTPCDPPAHRVEAVLASGEGLRGYPASVGSAAYREACHMWLERRFGITVEDGALAACIGTKELVTSLPHFLRLRDPDRDTVLYPELSYPSYAMGAQLAGCRAVPVAMDRRGRLDFGSVADEDAGRAVVLWVNSPGNPAGQIDDLAVVAAWAREAGVIVASDECYAEFTWDGDPRCILENGTDGLLAIHSVSKRSNLAGLRAGFYAGDRSLVDYLSLVRMHAGLMVPGPVQAAAAVAWSDDEHVARQAGVYRRRLARVAEILGAVGAAVSVPAGGIYLWVGCPEGFGDGWEFTEFLAREGGVVVSPGELYGLSGEKFVRVAAVQPDERIELVAQRLGA